MATAATARAVEALRGITPPNLDPVRSRCGRFTKNWQMIPALLALIGSIVALGAAILWNNHWLTVATGVATLGSIYGLYLTRRVKDLGDHKANNAIASQHLEDNAVLIEENRRLHAEATQLQTQLAGIQQLLASGAADYQDLNTQHSGLVRRLETITQAITRTGAVLGQHQAAGAAHLEALGGVAEKFESLMQGGDVQEMLAVLGDAADRLETATKQNEAAAVRSEAAAKAVDLAAARQEAAAARTEAAAGNAHQAASRIEAASPRKRGGGRFRNNGD